MLSQPFLKVGELDRPRLLQRTRSEPTYPVVVDAQGGSYSPMLPYSGLNRISRPLNPLFYHHLVLTL